MAKMRRYSKVVTVLDWNIAMIPQVQRKREILLGCAEQIAGAIFREERKVVASAAVYQYGAKAEYYCIQCDSMNLKLELFANKKGIQTPNEIVMPYCFECEDAGREVLLKQTKEVLF